MSVTRRRNAWVEIDHGAVSDNVVALRRLLKPGTSFMAVVKADGYGHGPEGCARAAVAAGADRLGVATVDEAVALRVAGLAEPLHLLSEAPPEAAGDIVEHGLTPTVFTRGFATALSAAAMRAAAEVPFHLKVDTGMNRVGVRPEEARDFVLSLAGLTGLKMEGVFTHLATADVSGDWDFGKQVERFDAMLRSLRDRGIDPGIVHAANSPATILHPEAHYDMVRCGIAIYGLHPAEATRDRVVLRPAMSVKARVVHVHRVPMGEGVSYGLTWRAASPTSVATLPLGYADGVHRVLSGEMRVLIGGVACRQIGRVCMDQLVVEVPRGHEVCPGDEAVIVGSQGGETILLDELAKLAGTINYEMACAFSMRLERVSL
ncbi:MAG: alanine racemase [Coriobacteriaceae bacterium]|nr:alanine racemase [Coriobacteriaceae bacterium]